MGGLTLLELGSGPVHLDLLLRLRQFGLRLGEAARGRSGGDASYWVRWISKRTWPSLTSAPSSNRTCSSTPWMRARSSTVWTASVCATNSAVIGTVFCVTRPRRRPAGAAPGGLAFLVAGEQRFSAMNASKEQRRAANRDSYRHRGRRADPAPPAGSPWSWSLSSHRRHPLSASCARESTPPHGWSPPVPAPSFPGRTIELGAVGAAAPRRCQRGRPERQRAGSRHGDAL